MRALARSPGAMAPRAGLTVIRGDALDAAAVTETIVGDPNTGWLLKAILPRVFAKQFADVREMENVTRDSCLDWTIARADVAHFIATTLTENAWLHDAPAVAY